MPESDGTKKKDPPKAEGETVVEVDTVLMAKISKRPVVLSLGSATRSSIKDLKRGTGKLVDEVRAAVQLAAADLGPDAEGQTLLPVVVVYRRKISDKKKRRGGAQGLCPLLCV